MRTRGDKARSIPRSAPGSLAGVGVKRISVGGSLSRLALAAFLQGAREMKDVGGFTWLRATVSSQELRGSFTAPDRPGSST